MDPYALSVLREFIASRATAELLIGAAVAAPTLALWIALRRLMGATAREATRRMGPAALASLAFLLCLAMRSLVGAQGLSILRDPSTDLNLATPLIGFALGVLIICTAIRRAQGACPSPGDGWGNAVIYLLLMAISYPIVFIAELFSSCGALDS